MFRWLSFSALMMICCSSTSTVVAQDDAMAEIYGQGLHRYFAGDYREAERLLSLVVDSGTLDARAHFYRGLSQYMQGRSDQAKYDFENGALAEARGKRVVAVGMALQRIQGPVRMEIEKARQAARVAVIMEQAQLRRQRGETARAQAGVMPAPAATLPGSPAPVPPPSVDATNPFSGVSGLQAGKPSVDASKPVTPAGDAAINPFGDDPTQAAAPGAMPAPAANNPFGVETPATLAVPPPATDPFSTPTAPAAGGAAADPFATPPAETPATPPAAGASTNPFGT